MFKPIKLAFIALVALLPTQALALEPFIIPQPTEAQFIKYEVGLERFFSLPGISDKAGTYYRTSDQKRRRDGWVFCSMLTAYSVGEHLRLTLGSYEIIYRDNPKKHQEESAYTLGVATAAIDSICTEHRAELIDFVEQSNK